ncbi:XdhC family protein [Oscillospiraceae bacterium CM]|nr:XdhC family protein [Oscillospiraceae bacterium CM]
MKQIAAAALDALRFNKPCALALTIESTGSTPRKAGAAMLVRNDLSIVGTIGGGVLEAAVMRDAARVIENRRAAVTEYALSENGVDALGAVCGGRARILINYLDSTDPENAVYFEALLNAACSAPLSRIVAVIPNSGHLARRNLCLILPDGGIVGGDFLGQNARAALGRATNGDAITLVGAAVFLFPVASNGAAFIFGGGHCGQSLAPLLHTVGFSVTVIDDRVDFANRSRFPEADEIIVPPSMDAPFTTRAFGLNSYIIIVTRGHQHDKLVLREALKTQAGYIGMIGSSKKREAVYRHLLDDGYTQEDLDRVSSPIGLDIGAETPAEIAVSIAAEMIRRRAVMRQNTSGTPGVFTFSHSRR